MTFSIDDVRDTVSVDITARLLKIEANAKDLLDTTAIALEASSSSLFKTIGEDGHAIFGTSSLVSAQSLTASARMMERLANIGHEEIAKAEAHARRARVVTDLFIDLTRDMRQMLALELEHKGEDAQWLAVDWETRAAEAMAALDTHATRAHDAAVSHDDSAKPPQTSNGTAKGSVDEDDSPGFNFDDVASGEEVVPMPAPDAVQDELVAIFQEEAREMLGSLRAQLSALAGDRSNMQNVASVERVYHTLKGAAATVGLVDVSGLAADLQARCEALLEAGGAVATETLLEIVAATDRMMAIVCLPPLALEAPRGDDESRAMAESRAVFIEEARELHAEATSLVAEMNRGGSAVSFDLLGALARIFHRMKGSASVVAHSVVMDEAALLQQMCEPTSSATSFSLDAVNNGLARLTEILGLVSRSASTNGHAKKKNGTRATPEAPVREEVTLAATPELWQAFTDECAELLEQLEHEVLGLETSDAPKERLRAVMRQLHTLKGVVNTVGLAPTGKVIHVVEDFIEGMIEAPVLPSMRAVATFLLSVHVDVRRNLRQAEQGWVETALGRVEADIRRVLSGNPGKADAETPPSRASVGASSAGPRSSRGSTDNAERRFIKVSTERLDTLMNLAGELVVSRSRLLSRVDALRVLQAELGRGSRRLLERVETFRHEYEFANLDGRRVAEEAPRTERPVAVQSVPEHSADDIAGEASWSGFSDIELDRYDEVNVLARSLAEITGDFTEIYRQLAGGLATLSDDSDAVGGIVSGIQSEITRARMVPLEFLFARLRLPVRDAATHEGKVVRVVTRGEDVNLDKTIADALFQPMLHLVRNAVAHGVELPNEREAGHKDRSGVITLAARQESGQIVLEVRDDGRGLDLEALRARGMAMGLIGDDVAATDPAVRDLVFAPGLSTQGVAGAVAGRGVGCDVVKRAIERLNGSIRVETRANHGTVFVIRLPLTLAITKVLLVRHQRQTFAVPLYLAERIIDAHEEPLVDSAGVRRVKVDGTYQPVRSLGDVFTSSEPTNPLGPVLVMRVGDQRMMLQVDAVVAQEEIVVKSLGALLTGHPLFAGVSIRGTGEIVMILDVPGLVDGRGITVPNATRERAQAATHAERATQVASPETDAGHIPTQAAVPPPATAVPAESRRLRVLFVDDSLSVRKVAEANLKALGADVTLAVDGIDALAKLREQPCDVIFTDLEMPRMHGYELIRELRFLPAYRELPIIVVTSRSGRKHQEQARAVGASDYLTKPFTPQILEAALQRWGKGGGGA